MVLAGDGAEWTWLVAEEKAVEAEEMGADGG